MRGMTARKRDAVVRIEFGEFVITDNKSQLDLDTIERFLARSYWANKRPRDKIEASIRNSLCFGIYHGARQVGFARVVTDYATMYYLCDVFIDEAYRGRELGKKLIETITGLEELRNLTGILGTKDAHGLYEKYGFERDRERFMRRTADSARRL
jgi:GNAT superfamily N-acetyltransferase